MKKGETYKISDDPFLSSVDDSNKFLKREEY